MKHQQRFVASTLPSRYDASELLSLVISTNKKSFAQQKTDFSRTKLFFDYIDGYSRSFGLKVFG